jgi:hypothetical protein
MEIKVITTRDSAYSAMLQLRNEVLRLPIGLSIYDEDLSSENAQILLVAIAENTVVGCVILQPIVPQKVKMRQMAVATHLQGNGIGNSLVKAAEAIALDKGYTSIEMNAREVAIPFYEQLGYEVVSELFSEVGIPHKKMFKKL